jgi:uncharacterized protein with PIN domain
VCSARQRFIALMKFLVDRMLGKLARDLRLLGYDTLYYKGKDLLELIDLGRKGRRIILTRNSRLIPKRPEDQIVQITQDSPALQLGDLISRGYIQAEEGRFFSRCLLCNALLERVLRREVEGKVPDFIFQHHKEFVRCTHCQKIYWPGTHHESMKKKLETLKFQ